MWSSLMTMEWKTVEILGTMLLDLNKNPFSQATTLFYCAKSKEKTKQAKCITFSISSEENDIDFRMHDCDVRSLSIDI